MAAGALTASQNTFNEFAKVLGLAQQNNEQPEVHVAPEGLASQFVYICSSLHRLCTDGQAGTDDLDPSFLRLEAHTWSLVMALYRERLSNILPPQSVRELLASNPYVPNSQLMAAIAANNRALRELQTIEQWVQATFAFPDECAPPASNEYQTFTRMDLAQKRRTRTAANGLVDALDPDAVNRPAKGSRDPGALNPEDAHNEEKLARSIFCCIRGGHLEDVATLARQSARPWWAASTIGSEGFSLDLVSGVSSGRHDGEMWIGNRRRRLWKECCMRAATSSLMSPLERAIYAAIAPTATTLPALLPFCKTFEDHLWARTIGLIQDKFETELSKVANQSYWESEGCGLGNFEPATVPDEDMDATSDLAYNDAADDAEWGRIAKEQLAEIGRIAVSGGAHASHPLHQAQMHIIMSTESALVEAMKVSALNNASPDRLRFYTHLALFFTLTDIPVSHDSVAVIVEKYIEVLQHLNMREHVALYTSFLGHSAVKRYSEFLASLPLDMQHQELKQSLLRAEKYHLDIKRVAEEAARTDSHAALARLPYDSRLPDVAEADQKALNELDRRLLRSVWWLSYHKSTHSSILRHSNAVVRSFLARGRITAAATVHNALPPDLLNPAPTSPDKVHLDQQEAEHLHFKRLFSVWDACSNVETMAEDEGRGGFDFTLGLSEVSATVDAFGGGWKRRFRTRVDEVRSVVVDLLTSDWLLHSLDPGDQSQRAQELRKIRKIFIPELIMRLTKVLQKAREHYPESVAHAMDLANILADGKHELYLCFVSHEGNRMGRYLMVLQDLLVDTLQIGGSDPLAPLASELIQPVVSL